VHFLCDSQSVRVPLEFLEAIVNRAKSAEHLLGVSGVGRAREHVVAYSFEIVFVAKLCEFVGTLDFHEEVDGFGFFVVVDELGDDLVDELEDVVGGFVFFKAILVLDADLAREAAEVLVAPANQVFAGAQKSELKGVILVLVVCSDHADDRDQVRQNFLNILVGLVLVVLLEFIVVRRKELERSRH